MTPSFLLTTEPWIPVWDHDVDAERMVGLTEALTRAHRLSLSVHQGEDVAVLRLLVAVFDAACGPRTAAEWEALWKAGTLDTDTVTAYLHRWEPFLDLFHPGHPAFQCGRLTDYHRGPEALHPGNLGGDGPSSWFNEELRAPLPPWPAAEAARLLLHLLTYDVAGIKRAVPADPVARGGKVFGAQVSTTAISTHVHVALPGHRLKDVLLLNTPPQPRAAGDAPVWERETPSAPMRTRTPTGRLDLLTWPTRRIRLHVTDDMRVDALAHHDGDRLLDNWSTTRRLDPMTAWTINPDGKPAPMGVLDLQNWPQPWRAALLLDHSAGAVHTCAVVQHTISAAERGILDPTVPVIAVASTVLHTNRHRGAIGGITVSPLLLGTAAQLADPDARKHLATMARHADALGANLRRHAAQISRRPAAQVAPRMLLTDLDHAWEDAVHDSAHDPHQARKGWGAALREAAKDKINAFPMKQSERAQLLAEYTKIESASEKSRTKAPRKRTASAPPAADTPTVPPAAGTPSKRRGPRATTYECFGDHLTLAEISRHPDCVVAYNTLRARVTDGWDVEEAATTPGRTARQK
ncbi:hypothetical protein GCM10010218_64240 [Streptomyces mashuensis]|uniref:Type I-E CRISPR-associated protein Cse1/CasA n=1 Tax=Streptomyces mashuensis TaxID=33904 RepID=A0A919EFJ8_9ACTN|nr:type I-E CRISPR-associated protein Cse1/CasA [Streptomyces mashuensis]GHF74260.1 hypothetical protein GCM10010218_64240 [Streptomyces mashuensis]